MRRRSRSTWRGRASKAQPLTPAVVYKPATAGQRIDVVVGQFPARGTLSAYDKMTLVAREVAARRRAEARRAAARAGAGEARAAEARRADEAATRRGQGGRASRSRRGTAAAPGDEDRAHGSRSGRLRKREPAEPVAPGALGGLRDPDPRARHDLDRRPRRGRSSNGGSSSAQPVVLARDGERLAEAARARSRAAAGRRALAAPASLDTCGRLERPDQDRVGDALAAADEVQAPVDAVGAVDVGVPGRRGTSTRCARRRSAEAVRGRVLVVVRLDLDDDPADAVDVAARPDQLGRDLDAPAAYEVMGSFAS